MNSLAPAPSTESRPVPQQETRGQLSLADLYDRFGSTAYSLALSITNDSQTAERIVAASFTDVWRQYDQQFASIPSFFSDLMNTVRARAVAHKPSTSGRAGFAEVPAKSGALQGAVTTALRELCSTEQQILALAYFGGLAVNDIASRLQQPLTAVKAGLKSALAHVRSRVAETSPGTVSV